MPSISNFVSENWKWLITVLIFMGVLYSQFQTMQNDVDRLKVRQQTYIDRYNQQTKLIHDLEIRLVVLETELKN